MGQGTDSCGGYEVDFNPYEDGLCSGLWTEKSGREILIKDMTERHLKGAIKVCENASVRASFSCDSDLWGSWAELLGHELSARPTKVIDVVKKKGIGLASKPRGAMVNLKCHCGNE